MENIIIYKFMNYVKFVKNKNVSFIYFEFNYTSLSLFFFF